MVSKKARLHLGGRVGGGHLEVLQWTRENDGEWDWSTCSYAAEGGHLELLQWARENGCEWDSVDGDSSSAWSGDSSSDNKDD